MKDIAQAFVIVAFMCCCLVTCGDPDLLDAAIKHNMECAK